MKPWLLNILACPIDKHHPLKVRFFSWETSPEEIQKISSEAGSQSSKKLKSYRILAKQLKDGTISPAAMQAIEDLTGSKDSAKLLTSALESIDRIEQISNKSEDELIRDFIEDLDRIHSFMNLVEVDTGLIVCPKCGRWYPIGSSVETIPELLPDDLREKDRDLAWLEKWRKLVPQNILQEGKPHNLNG
jgi:uncharacterized protein YbaR (Trm112 family)